MLFSVKTIYLEFNRWKSGSGKSGSEKRGKAGQPELAHFRLPEKVSEQTGTFSRKTYGTARHYRFMPRNPRCVLPEVAYHVTQRGVDRADVFFSQADRDP